MRAFEISLVLVLIQERIPERGTSRLLELAFHPDRHFEDREDPWDEVSSVTKRKIVGMRKEVEIVPAHFEFSLVHHRPLGLLGWGRGCQDGASF